MTSATLSHTPIREFLGESGHRIGRVATRFYVRHRLALPWISPVLVISAIVSFLNFSGSPQRIDDEGTYTAQAYAVSAFGQLAHYTYSYDHPPLGWIQIAGYAQLTGAFSRYDLAVLAAREAVIVATLISVVLVWALARRLGIGRAASAVAALVFALSPLALQFHRTVYLDNIALPWLLGAFILALNKRSQLASFAASAALFSIAVLSKETFLLALPFLAWMMVRSSHKATRRYTLSVAGTVLVLVGSSYLLLAAIKGELLPSPGKSSLTDGVLFQLGSRAGSGSVIDPNSLIVRTFSMWWQLDPVIIVLGTLASVSAVFFTRLRPIAVMMVFLIAAMFRPNGYLPVPYVIVLLPFAAILIAAMAEKAVRAVRHSRGATRIRAGAWVAVTAVAVVAAVPLWTVQLRGFLLADLDSPLRSAESWAIDNIPHSNRMIVDDAMWVDLVKAGWSRDNVLWYYKLDTDPAVKAGSPQGWKDSDYVITTDSMRSFPNSLPQVKKAITNSVVVASFGRGTQAVDIRRIEPDGLSAAKKAAATQTAQASTAGTQLAGNPGLSVSAANRDLLTGGRVDIRIPLALGSQLAIGSVTVSGFPMQAGEGDQPRRVVRISALDGEPAVRGGSLTAAAKAYVAGLTGQYSPASVSVVDGSMQLVYSPAAPSGVVS
ncbi:ArnT family glycosyltransferase [Lacisediminihabitans sp. FW035]